MANDILGTRSPNGAVGVRGVADSGELSMLSAGVLSGFGVSIGANLVLNVGGEAGVQDVAVAKNSAGESDLLVGNGGVMQFTLPAAPGTSGQSQAHTLVVWKDATVVSTENDGIDAVGYEVVSGASATTGQQKPPTDGEIRAAIPNGSTAFVSPVVDVTLAYGDTAPSAAKIVADIAKIAAPQLPLDLMFPVGYIWQSIKNVNPGTFLGGTWAPFAQGRTLVGVGNNGETNYNAAKMTGGEETHNLTATELPEHTHTYPYRMMVWDANQNATGVAYSTVPTSPVQFNSYGDTTGVNTTEQEAHNNMQPYVTVYMWERTA